MEQQRPHATFDPKARTVVVIAGAAARGPYEAAVMAEALPALFGDDLSNVVLVGTSAGAINAALWAAKLASGARAADVGQQVKDVWASISQRDVFVTISALGALLRLAVRGGLSLFLPCDCNAFATYALLNTDPLRKTAERAFDPDALKRNVDEGRLLGVGAVATSYPNDGSGGRSRVFVYGRPELYQPALTAPPRSSIDYVPLSAGLKLEHVLASAAIPLAFMPVQISEPAQYAGWYVDGGVRMNTPIRPALDMGASQLVVISSLATSYPEASALATVTPNIFDVSSQALHTILGDGTIEDLRSLQRINGIVAQAEAAQLQLHGEDGKAYRVVKFLTISPPLNGALSVLAEQQLKQASSWCRLEYRALSAVLASAGAGAGTDELASYLLFYPPYADALFECAATDVAVKAPLRDAFCT